MVLQWGRPTLFNDSVIDNTLSWSQCITKCQNDIDCVIAYQNGKTCNNYPSTTASTVTQLTASSKSQVALKVAINGTECPRDLKSLTEPTYLVYKNTVKVYESATCWLNSTKTTWSFQCQYDAVYFNLNSGK
ncbi:hypothetical protein B9Z55_015834 [Caenorhabditis nigoni]|uniref:PAN-3 domain-containing protein n=1 Tax=Caenorhabditis nigoni TaxID=1611254 RepID=A0A2G5UCT5_9PELO|nr:hypothetical protein B9Z55_015834 [Caenorhabditis nigoni]